MRKRDKRNLAILNLVKAARNASYHVKDDSVRERLDQSLYQITKEFDLPVMAADLAVIKAEKER